MYQPLMQSVGSFPRFHNKVKTSMQGILTSIKKKNLHSSKPLSEEKNNTNENILHVQYFVIQILNSYYPHPVIKSLIPLWCFLYEQQCGHIYNSNLLVVKKKRPRSSYINDTRLWTHLIINSTLTLHKINYNNRMLVSDWTPCCAHCISIQ